MASSRTRAPDLGDAILLVLLACLWGASYTFIRVGVETIPPLTFVAGRTLVASGILLLWMRLNSSAMPRDRLVWMKFAVQAILNTVLPFVLIAWAERSVDAGVASILNGATPIFTFVGGWFLSKRDEATIPRLLGVAAGLAGIGLVVGVSAIRKADVHLVPELAVLLATLSYSAAALYGRAFEGIAPTATAAGSLLCGTVLLAPACLIFDRPWAITPSWRSLVALLALATLSTAVAFTIYFRLMQRIGSVATTAQAYLRVPVGVLLGAVVLDESISSSAWLGMAFVLVGVVAMNIRGGAAITMKDRTT